MTPDQAIAYVKLFGEEMTAASTPENKLRAADLDRQIGLVDYYVENNDTLLYAVNYRDKKGYVLLSSNNGGFPIIAHSDAGELRFSDIDEENPLWLVIMSEAERAKDQRENPDRANLDYYNDWKDIGNPDYQYEIEPTSEVPTSRLRAMRKHSTGKKAIHPYTGEKLVNWCQFGTFNTYAPNQAAIGCPALAIGMLLFDCAHRDLSKREQVMVPNIPYHAERATMDNEDGKRVSMALKQIADSIPNYRWGAGPGAESAANALDILEGLKKLGFRQAELHPYDFETLYQNMSYKDQIYGPTLFDVSRGVLIGANDLRDPSKGHIWFCDGYYEQSFKVTKKFLFIKIKSWTEYDDRLYMNWGWGPNKGNGWYSADDYIWTSIQEGKKYFKLYPMMYTNLRYYTSPEYPQH
ncbi:hypothetical protein HMPREF2890_02450 [Porphyromonas sp. HMSC065F10]|nr:hypothetical protein HMPREF2890_02450 [Porphyromonas sp. HMSC065F10]